MLPFLKYYLFFAPLSRIVPVRWIMRDNGVRLKIAIFAMSGAYWAAADLAVWPFSISEGRVYPELQYRDCEAPF